MAYFVLLTLGFLNFRNFQVREHCFRNGSVRLGERKVSTKVTSSMRNHDFFWVGFVADLNDTV